MVKEIFISLYLFVFKAIFNLFRWCPLKDKVAFVVSFGDNSQYIYNEMLRQNVSYDVIFLNKGVRDLWEQVGAIVISFETFNIIDMVRSIYHLATSKKVIIDNYYGFLSAVQFKKDVECIQLWHAAGAIKTFGLKDKSIINRSKKAKKRYTNVYHKFDKVVVGSEDMAKIFMDAFGLESENILRTGIPKTDLFYDVKRRCEIINGLENKNPALKNKKAIMYAPTYRDNQLYHPNMKLDLELLKHELGEDYILLLRFHPAINYHVNYEEKYPGFVYDYSSWENLNELLLVTDYLITDYSSIPYEYALLNKPMIFFPVDLEYYETKRGLWGDYKSLVPGPVVHSTAGIVEMIKENSFDLGQVQAFAQRWNQYSDGCSSKKFVHYLFDKDTARSYSGSK